MTLLISTVLAIAAYLLKNEVLDPIRAFRAARWRAAVVLVVHENVLTNTGLSTFEAKADVRRLAAEIKAQYKQIPFARFLGGLGLVPADEAVGRAVTLLIRLSNTNDGGANRMALTDVRDALKIT